MRPSASFLYIQYMSIRLVHKKAEANVTGPEFQGLLDRLAALYSNDVAFKYDADQNAVVVTKAGRVLGSARTEGALHTIVWATLSLAEKEA